eukprot:g4317.t1
MEDTHDFRIDFMEFPVDFTRLQNVIPPELQLPDGWQKSQRESLRNKSHSTKGKIGASKNDANCVENFHLFCVFDGHGGAKAAEHCTETLAQNLKLQITQVLHMHSLPNRELHRRNTVPTHVLLPEPMDGLKEQIFPQRKNSGDGLVLCSLTNPPEKDPAMKLGQNGLTSDQLMECLDQAFVQTDAQFDNEKGRDESGTTAILALVSNNVLCFSHCGDCRGVLFQNGGEIMQLTREHSPASTAEEKRISELGGYVLTLGRADVPRVMGVLSMTRSIGDFGLKPFIIPNPETTILRRSVRDEFIVLASDGLWGVLNNSEVCDLVNKCFECVESKGLSRHNASKLATHFLIKTAMDHGSSDNITVFVIDLRQYH